MKKLRTILKTGLAVLITASVGLVSFGANYLPNTTYIDGSTNVVIVAGTNALVSWVPTVSTNFYQLPNSNLSTNAFPQVSITPLNVVVPSRMIAVYASLISTNASACTFQLAASVDGANWITNWSRFTLTGNGTGLALGTPVSVITNIDTFGIPFINLYSIEALNGQATNIVFRASGKAGL